VFLGVALRPAAGQSSTVQRQRNPFYRLARLRGKNMAYGAP
jgi:hypothetical protein